MEQRFLEMIMAEGAAEQEFYIDYLQSTYGLPGGSPGLADIVHVLVRLGIERLEHEAAEISYAAEAAAETEEDRAVTGFLSGNLAEIAARDEG
jgi:hypothetical protein